jgi:hypothetical protein
MDRVVAATEAKVATLWIDVEAALSGILPASAELCQYVTQRSPTRSVLSVVHKRTS